MTYCIGYWLEKGLVLASDSRTNAGVDYISTYSKMHVFQPAPDRLFVVLAAGSLATTQAVINWIRRDLDRPADLESGSGKDLRHCDYLFEAAAYLGRVSVAAQKENADALRSNAQLRPRLIQITPLALWNRQLKLPTTHSNPVDLTALLALLQPLDLARDTRLRGG
jgi:predicted proteasome-type protease